MSWHKKMKSVSFNQPYNRFVRIFPQLNHIKVHFIQFLSMFLTKIWIKRKQMILLYSNECIFIYFAFVLNKIKFKMNSFEYRFGWIKIESDSILLYFVDPKIKDSKISHRRKNKPSLTPNDLKLTQSQIFAFIIIFSFCHF